MGERSNTMTGTSSQSPAQLSYGYSMDDGSEQSGWVGWIVFAAVMIGLLGIAQAIMGLVALFDSDYYVVASDDLLVHVDYTAWGWVHLLVGLVAILAAVGLLRGQTWARVVGVLVALLSAIVNVSFLAAAPVWTATSIAIDVLVIYAIAVHGAELRRR